MTYALLDDHWADAPATLSLPRSTRLLFVEGLLYCAKHLTDGQIPANALARLTDDPDPTAGAATLVGAGVWQTTEAGWEVVGYLEELRQSSRASVEKRRADNAEMQDRSRRHKIGDHSKCLKGWYCPDGQVERVRPDNRSKSRTQSGAPLLSSPFHSSPRSERGVERDKGASAQARSGSPARSRPKGFTVTMPTLPGGEQ